MIEKRSIELNGRTLSIEMGKVALQADGAAWVQYGDTVILATVVSSKQKKENADYFPLMVDYREKTYAAGKIPGGFFKREGRPSEKEILSARLIDRPIRPLFPKDYMHETQVVIYVLSSDKENDADVLGTIGASAALTASDVPFSGPIGAIRLGRINGEYCTNPTFPQLEECDFEMIVAASEDSILMVEGEAKEIGEDEMIDAIQYAHEEIKKLLPMQIELQKAFDKTKRDVEEVEIPEGLEDTIVSSYTELIDKSIRVFDKKEREETLKKASMTILEELEEQYPESEHFILGIAESLEKKLMRKLILDEKVRVDGRAVDEIRPITCEIDVLPRVHGTSIFTRGQTQSLASVTLGSKFDEQKIDGLNGLSHKRFMLHYNFPSFSVGETRPERGPSRRDIGHGNLAERAIKTILPEEKDFPYTIRLVSEVLESNGSSSMATVCAGSMALMEAGVTTPYHIGGIAMGLIKEEKDTVILSDINGMEDHLGDMDFKVAGSEKGVTAFQMDIKIDGISFDIMRSALAQAKVGRLHIINEMKKAISEPNTSVSRHAPKILSMSIKPDEIGMLIGPGGKMIREIQEKSSSEVFVEDDGSVFISSADHDGADLAVNMISRLFEKPEVGKTYKATVKKIMNFGAFVEILPGKEGLVHISELENRRVNKVEDVCKVGDEMMVKLKRIDPDGRMDLSRKALL